jgi:hypothetical protein
MEGGDVKKEPEDQTGAEPTHKNAKQGDGPNQRYEFNSL